MNKLIIYIIVLISIVVYVVSIPVHKVETINNFEENNTISEMKGSTVQNVLLNLEIEKINLKQDVLMIDDENNNIEKHVTIMKESNMPYVTGGNLILGAHSGQGSNAYFNNLIHLEKDDIINIYHNGIKYSYRINSIYDDDKNNKIIIRRDLTKNTLTLFTCKNNDKKYYLVIIAYLLDKTE